jgi:hypothetical protein
MKELDEANAKILLL